MRTRRWYRAASRTAWSLRATSWRHRGGNNGRCPPVLRAPPKRGTVDGAGGNRRRRDLRRHTPGDRPRSADGDGHARRIRRHARDSWRDSSAEINRAVISHAVGGTADIETGQERNDGEAWRPAGAVRSIDTRANDSGEAIGAEAGGRGNRAGKRAVPARSRTECDRGDEGGLRHPAGKARRLERRHRFPAGYRAGETGSGRRPAARARAQGKGEVGRNVRWRGPVGEATQAREGAVRSAPRRTGTQE